jgi:hypothetical protein
VLLMPVSSVGVLLRRAESPSAVLEPASSPPVKYP